MWFKATGQAFPRNVIQIETESNEELLLSQVHLQEINCLSLDAKQKPGFGKLNAQQDV